MKYTYKDAQTVLKEARKFITKHKPEKIIFEGDEIIVKNLKCYQCGNAIYVEPASINKKFPNGFLWVCDICGEVTEQGVPARMIDQAWEHEETAPLTEEPNDNVPF